MGVLEAAGMPFDALWVAGLSAHRWPPSPQPNAFLPLAWQRERGVPRSSPARELDYGRALTAELARSASYVVMSHPTTVDDQPSAASALIPVDAPPLILAGLRPESAQIIRAASAMESIADERAPPLAAGPFRGGAGAIAAQSDCPFRTTARYRLRVDPWPAAAEGLNYMERGHLVHAAMAAFWRHTGSHAALVALDSEGLAQRVDAAVDAARAVIAPARWRLLPPAIAAAEASRIAVIGMQWIESYERPRPAFVVTATEAATTLTLSGLTFSLRLDRIDALEGGGSAIIDYKAGAVDAPRRWFAARPRAPQLGVYALALAAAAPPVSLRAVAYAKLKAGEIRALGLAADDAAWPALAKPSSIREPNTWEGVERWWRAHLTPLATELRDGVATVTPRDSGAPCRTCGFQPLCRIRAAGLALIDGDAGDE